MQKTREKKEKELRKKSEAYVCVILLSLSRELYQKRNIQQNFQTYLYKVRAIFKAKNRSQNKMKIRHRVPHEISALSERNQHSFLSNLHLTLGFQ